MMTNQVAEASPQYVAEIAPCAVPEGYKDTEVGVIPNAWECRSLGELCSLKSGLGITSKYIDNNSQYRCYGGNGLRGYTKTFTHDGEFALIGRQGALCGNVQYVSGRFFASEHALVATPFKGVNAKWLAIYFERMNLNQYSESSAQPGLSAEKLRVLNLITPTRDEQTSIANALSDVDTLISELEKLIAKKQAIKTATMQQLLTGRTRLPQFALHEDGSPKGYKPSELGEIPEDWECRSLGEHCSLKSGLGITSEQIDDSYEYPCYGGNGLRGFTTNFTHEGNFVLIGRQGALCGNIQYVTGKFFASEHALVATCAMRTDSKWLAIYLDRMNLNQYSESSAQPGLSAEKLRVLRLITPTNEEQAVIAMILSDMDKEIETLEQRLAKTRQIKQGMMQELLTGKTRLVKGSKEDIHE